MTATADANLESYSDVEYVFEPGNETHPPVREYLADVWARRHFVVALAHADIQGANSNRLLGQIWALLDPLFQAAIYFMLITLVRGGAQGQNGPQRAALIIGGVFLFSQFRVAFADGSREVQKRKGLVLNSTFPMMIFPLSAMYRGLIEFLPAVGVYFIFHVIAGMPFGPGLFLLPLLFALQLLMGLGICLLTTTATIFVRDMQNVVGYILRVLFFMTPVIYPVSALNQVGPFLRAIIWINPLFPLFAAYQACLGGGVPTPGQVFGTIAWTVFYLVLGYWVFVTHERAFAIRL